MAQRKDVKIKINWRKLTVVAVAAYVFCQCAFGIADIMELKKQEAALEEELEAAYQEQADLKEDIDYMQSEEAIEKAAREKLGLIKEGEILIQRVTEE